MQERESLMATGLFEGIGEAEIDSLLSCLLPTRQSYARGALIKLEGEPADFIGVVLDGTIRVVKSDYSGGRSVMGAFGPGHLFAEAFACAGIPRLPVSIEAAGDCRVWMVNFQRVMNPCGKACPAHNRLPQNLLRIVARKNVLLNTKCSILSERTTADKLMAFLNEQARQANSNEFVIRYDRQALADYLGVERSAMAAEIGKLRKQGILETRRSYFKLLEG